MNHQRDRPEIVFWWESASSSGPVLPVQSTGLASANVLYTHYTLYILSKGTRRYKHKTACNQVGRTNRFRCLLAVRQPCNVIKKIASSNRPSNWMLMEMQLHIGFDRTVLFFDVFTRKKKARVNCLMHLFTQYLT